MQLSVGSDMEPYWYWIDSVEMHSGSVQNEAGLRSGAVQGLHLTNQAQAERGLVSEMSLTSVSAEKNVHILWMAIWFKVDTRKLIRH